jgi:Zn-dependent peptidase ImmA (M78 family)/transcriptional regulator with XRE-family HTH domain
MPKVNPAILRWARETAGLDQAEAAERLKIRDARGVAALDRLKALEDGEDTPSRPLLVRMAKQYRRPLLTFYLGSPPPQGDRGQDFRTLPRDQPPDDEPLLDALIRDVQARQSMIRSALLDEDDVQLLDFIGSETAESGVEALVASIRSVLKLPLEEYRQCRDVDDAFGLLRARTEEAGVFVLLLGNLGSHHTNIDLDTFRGFAIADDVAPFLVINDQDHHAAWSFTLLHELTHLWLGETGVSGGRPELAVERFCNEVASEFLLPASELAELAEVGHASTADAAGRIGEFASSRKVSHSMVAYKLFTHGLVDAAKWSTLSHFFRERWLSERERRRERARESEGGPSYYVVRRHRLGTALVEATARLMATGSLTTSKAGTVLGVKPKNVQGVLSEYPLRAS